MEGGGARNQARAACAEALSGILMTCHACARQRA